MKILKYILYLIIALVVLFFAFGLLTPKVKYQSEVVVDKPIKEAWAVSQDDSKYAEWLEGFQSMELLSGNKFEVGSTYKIIVQPGDGQPPFEMIETLESIKEFDHVEMTFDSDMMDFYQKMTFEEKDGKTIIKTDNTVVGNGIIMHSMFALMEGLGGTFTKQESKNQNGLKRVIEENTTDYFPIEVEE